MKGDLAQGDVTLVTEKLEVSGGEWRWPSDEETRSWDRVGRGGGGEERRGWSGQRLEGEADPCRLVNRRNGPEKGEVFAKKRTEVVNVDDAWITMY